MATKVLEAVLGMSLLGNGQVEFAYGSLKIPFQCSLTDPLHIRRNFSVPASGKVTLWDYAVEPMGFSALVVVCSGSIDLAVRADKPTSSTDFTPLGTHKGWTNIPVDCMLPLFLNSDDFLVNSTPADMASDTADEPTAWGDSGTERGLAYMVKARNPNTSTVIGTIVLIGSR